MTDIYVVRHCESMANRICSFAGRTDVEISAKGRMQLDCLSEYFKNIKIDKIYTSPLIRARKTAEAINKYPKAPIIEDESFIEIDLGVLDGKPVSAMSDEQTYCWNMAPHLFSVEGGESMEQVADRMIAGIRRIVRENPGKTLAVSTHGGAIRNLIRVIKGFAPIGIREVDWCDNTGVNHLVFEDENNGYLDFENDTSHLTEEAAAVPVADWTNAE